VFGKIPRSGVAVVKQNDKQGHIHEGLTGQGRGSWLAGRLAGGG
jgi:hypothetical protein